MKNVRGNSQAHLEIEADENVSRGISPAGGPLRRAAEIGKHERGSRGDLSYEQPGVSGSVVAGRPIPLFGSSGKVLDSTAVAITTLALGIGANSADV